MATFFGGRTVGVVEGLLWRVLVGLRQRARKCAGFCCEDGKVDVWKIRNRSEALGYWKGSTSILKGCC